MASSRPDIISVQPEESETENESYDDEFEYESDDSEYVPAFQAASARDSFFYAVKTGDSARVSLILALGRMHVNDKDRRDLGFSAIHYAAMTGNEDMMQVLLDCRNINLDAQDNLGRTALIIASEEGKAEIVEILLEKKADPLKFAKGKFTCLHMAAFKGHIEVVDLVLLDRQNSRIPAFFLPLTSRMALLNAKSSEEEFTALHMAASGDHPHGKHIAASLLEAYMTCEIETQNCPMRLQHLVDAMSSLEGKGIKSMLDFLLEIRDVLSEKDVLSKKGELSKDQEVKVRVHLVKSYVNYWANEFGRKVRPLKPLEKHVKRIKALDWKGPIPTWKPIMTYFVNGFMRLVSFANATDSVGRTAMHYAAWTNKADVVKFLVWDLDHLDDGRVGSVGDVNATDLDGYTPLHFAAWKGNTEVVRVLLSDLRQAVEIQSICVPSPEIVTDKFRIHLDGTNNTHECNNLRPNSLAGPNKEWLRITKIITNKSAEDGILAYSHNYKHRFVLLDSDLRENFGIGGLTALHCASDRNQSGVVKLLLSHPQVEILVKSTVQGFTALECAVERNRKETVEVFVAHPRSCFAKSTDGQKNWAMIFSKGYFKAERWNEPTITRMPVDMIYLRIRHLVKKAIIELGNEDNFSNAQELFTSLEIQIFLFFVESVHGALGDEENNYIPTSLDNNNFYARRRYIIRKKYHDLLVKYNREAFESEVKQRLEKWGTSEGTNPWSLTLLHIAVYYGLDDQLKKLLSLGSSKLFANTREEICGKTALDLAISLCNANAITFLLEAVPVIAVEVDSDGKTPLEFVLDMQSPDNERLKASDEDVKSLDIGQWKSIERLLLGSADVQRFVDNLYRDRQVYVDAANAILVGAALIASVTFAGWLQPPLGYTTYYQEFYAYPAPPGTTESFAGVQQHASIRAFWVFNSLSFFSAVATVIAGAGTVLPAPGQFIRKEVKTIRKWLVCTSMLLTLSIFCVLGAFTSAGIAVLPPISKYLNNMIGTSVVGFTLCLVVLWFFLEKLYQTSKHMLQKVNKQFSGYTNSAKSALERLPSNFSAAHFS